MKLITEEYIASFKDKRVNKTSWVRLNARPDQAINHSPYIRFLANNASLTPFFISPDPALPQPQPHALASAFPMHWPFRKRELFQPIFLKVYELMLARLPWASNVTYCALSIAPWSAAMISIIEYPTVFNGWWMSPLALSSSGAVFRIFWAAARSLCLPFKRRRKCFQPPPPPPPLLLLLHPGLSINVKL